MKGKKQAGKLKDPVYIRTLIEGRFEERLREESDQRRISMNMIVREMLEERYALE